MTADEPPPPAARRAGHGAVPGRDELPVGLVLRIILATVMIGASLCFATYLILRGKLLQLRPSYRFSEGTLPAPHEVSRVRQGLFNLANPAPDTRAWDRAFLESSGWVDRPKGLVHIPVETAIELTANGFSPGGGPR